jgi:hypothetical protein
MLLPSKGRWHLVNPWSPFANNPPFSVIDVDLVKMSGDAFYYSQTSSLQKVDRLSPFRFGALYQMRGHKGLFEAQVRDDGWLDIYFIGTVKTDCSAYPVRRQWPVKRIAILTTVGNLAWHYGPGHTALAVDGTVYSFEFPHFRVSTVQAYFARPDIIQRPVVVQELDCQMLDASAVLDYLRYQVEDDIYFIRHNWCSYQAAMALKHGNEQFEPEGIDTPWEVYNRARQLGMTTRTYFIWDPSKAPSKDLEDYWNKMSGGGRLPWYAWYYGPHIYSDVAPAAGPEVRGW